jgi:hypothetical protein
MILEKRWPAVSPVACGNLFEDKKTPGNNSPGFLAGLR